LSNLQFYSSETKNPNVIVHKLHLITYSDAIRRKYCPCLTGP